MPSPRNLDPKFKDEKDVPDEVPETVNENDEVPQIVFRQQVQEGDTVKEIVHGPMPVTDWAAYEKEHGL